jgi:6-phosphogluconolactonase (cycloisomerase 2 family)
MRNVVRSLSLMALSFSVSIVLSLSQESFAQDVSAQNQSSQNAGAVFVMTNDVSHNQVISYGRAADGSLLETGKFATGGRGTGGTTDPLESQGSLVLSHDHSLLLAVNGGSGEVSTFHVRGTNLLFADRVVSGGSEPNAIAQWGSLVYVLNVGGSSNVVGFRLSPLGQLHQIPSSTRFLTTNNSEGASIAFSPDGHFLLVTERATNNIDVFPVQANGTLGSIVVNASVDPGVFSLRFAPNGAVVVSETGPAGASNASTVSSYVVGADGKLSPISTDVPALGDANCWNAITPDGKFAYTSNAASATISGFAIAATGALTPLSGTVVGTNPAGSTNLDIATSADGKFLYSLNSGTGVVGIFGIRQDGTLNSLGDAGGLASASGFNGIAAY